MGISGANVEQLELLAKRMDECGSQLDAVLGRLEFGLRTTNWAGGDGVRFRADWAQAHRPQLARVAAGLREASVALLRNAGEQRMASGEMGGAVGLPFGGVFAAVGSQSAAGQPMTAEQSRLLGLAIEHFGGMVDRAGEVGMALDWAEFGMVLKYGGKIVDALGDATAWGKFTNILGGLSVATGTFDLGMGINTQDGGRVASGAIDVSLGAASLFLGTSAAPVLVPLGVAKAYLDATVPYTKESQDSLNDYMARTHLGTTYDEMTDDQKSALDKRYEGFGGALNKISDKMNQTGEPIRKAGDKFWRRIGLKK